MLHSKYCIYLLYLYDVLTYTNSKVDKFLDKFYFDDKRKKMKDMYEKLGYNPDDTDVQYYTLSTINNASKCYLILLSPLLALTYYTLLSTFFEFMFFDRTILFTHEYVKLLIGVPVALAFFIMLVFIVFKYLFAGEKKFARLYIHSVLMALTIPLLVVPQMIHSLSSSEIEFTAIVKKSYANRNADDSYLKLKSQYPKLESMKFSKLNYGFVSNIEQGDTILVKGKISTFYFKYDVLQKLTSSP